MLAIPGFLIGCDKGKAEAPRAPVAAPAAVKFTDATKAAGLDFVQSFGGCGMRYFVEQVAAGACVLDADGDGDPDVYFPAPKPLGECVPKWKGAWPKQRLYLNDGKGKFTLKPNAFDSETDYGIGAASADYDNDGDVDLYIACFGKNKLFRNRGDATFEDVTAKAGVALGGFSTGAAWLDYDGDGDLDLYALRYCEWTVETDIPCPGPNGLRDVCEPRIYQPSTNRMYRNNGDGTFTDVTQASGMAGEKRRSLTAAAADFDLDGKIDLFVTNDLGPNYLFHNLGSGKMRDVAMMVGVAFGITGSSQANMGLAIGDYDGSGRLSALVTTFANEPYTLYRNDGSGFVDVSAATGIAQATYQYLGWGAGFLDTRNSGLLDVFFANGHISPFTQLRDPKQTYKQRNQVLLNDGQGKFTELMDALPKDDVKVHRGAAFADFDGDGRVDILVTASDDRPTLLKNETPAGNWLMLRLRAKNGCATPIGARSVATVGGKQLLRVVMSGGGYGGDSDVRVHFGLGDAKQADKIEITWPSGPKQTLGGVAAGRVLDVREP